jgi:hypothetical protein
VADSVHRPARLTGGAAAAEPPGGAPPLGGLFEELLSQEKRSLPLQAASNAVEARMRTVAMRVAMKTGRHLKGMVTLSTRLLPPCQGTSPQDDYRDCRA